MGAGGFVHLCRRVRAPQRGCGPGAAEAQPRWGCWGLGTRVTQGSSFLATLGSGTESRWDSPRQTVEAYRTTTANEIAGVDDGSLARLFTLSMLASVADATRWDCCVALPHGLKAMATIARPLRGRKLLCDREAETLTS